ncbi:MAG: glycosyltransferase family 2 protein [Microgenomates group bacterium]
MTKYLLPELSLYLLCYNEEKNIAKTFTSSVEVLKKTAKKWEIILVNDGSTDNSATILRSLQSQYPQNVKIVTHPHNRGYGAAFKSGAYHCQYEWISFIDGDGQFDYSEIDRLITTQKSTHADLVIGYYKQRQVPWFRLWGTALWQLAVFFFFRLNVRDIDCGFKLFSQKVINTIPSLEAERGPFISSEFLLKSKKSGFKIVEVGVTHYPRTEGQGTGANLNVVLAGLVDLVRLWYKLNFKNA